MPEESEQLYLENQLCFPLYAASRLTTKVYAPLLQRLDLTYPQYLVMLVLWQHGTQAVSTIGTKLFLESNTVTPLLKRLEKKELLARKRALEDERTVMVSITEKGMALKEKAAKIPQEIIGSFRDERISSNEIQQFQITLFKLLNVLDEKVNAATDV